MRWHSYVVVYGQVIQYLIATNLYSLWSLWFDYLLLNKFSPLVLNFLTLTYKKYIISNIQHIKQNSHTFSTLIKITPIRAHKININYSLLIIIYLSLSFTQQPYDFFLPLSQSNIHYCFINTALHTLLLKIKVSDTPSHSKCMVFDGSRRTFSVCNSVYCIFYSFGNKIR